MLDAAAARDRLLTDHEGVLRTTLRCADAVAASWDAPHATDREQVVGPLRAALQRTGVLPALPDLLADAVAAAGGRLQAPPVAAPPYVTVTSRGPVLRATLPEGRLVVTLAVFAVERDPTRYVRGATTPEEALEVAIRTS
jgi:hypothetical protein